jgi:hypothetical protein
MTQKPKANGGIAELTPDAIRADGLSVAEHIRQLGKKAFTQGESVAALAEQVSTAIMEATGQMADRVAIYMENCEAARQAMDKHRNALSTPQPPHMALAPPPVSPVTEATGFAAVEKELGELERAISPESAKEKR